jgi:hypothetical protein
MNTTTSALRSAAHAALRDGRYSSAVALLDELAKRSDVQGHFASADAYGVPEHLRAVVQDRIELVNTRG